MVQMIFYLIIWPLRNKQKPTGSVFQTLLVVMRVRILCAHEQSTCLLRFIFLQNTSVQGDLWGVVSIEKATQEARDISLDLVDSVAFGSLDSVLKLSNEKVTAVYIYIIKKLL